MQRRQILSLTALLTLGAAPIARGQTTRGGPITLVVPFAAGGQIDAAARKFGARLSMQLGRTVLVDNKVGASGVIAAQYVMRSRPDGSTLLATSSSFLIAPRANRNAGYDAFKDFTVVSGLYASPAVLVANPKSPATTARAFIEMARQAPGKFSYATNGVGSFSHLLMEKFMADAGIELVHVPYRSLPEASQAVMQGLVAAAIETPFSAAPRAKSGQLRPLLVFSPNRESTLPDVPTSAEAGYVAASKLNILSGIVAPAQTPKETVEELARAANAVLHDAQYGADLRGMGMEPVLLGREQLVLAMREHDAAYSSVITRQKIDLTP